MRVDFINSKNLSSLETNDVFRQKLATTRASKYANLVKAFSKNQIPHKYKMFKEELSAYHEDMFIWYIHFELHEFELLGFNIFYIIVHMFNFIFNIKIFIYLFKVQSWMREV